MISKLRRHRHLHWRVALGIPIHRLVQAADSVSVCLSKGLGAPAGTVIVGSKDFITRAKTLRKTLGGGMRQVGVLCAAALVAVQEIVGKLESDHNNANEGLNRIEGLKVVVNSVETNIFLDVPVPAACVILICLFALQHYGSHKIGFIFMRRISPGSWGLLGSILLCAAGSEAMFADLGHFSKRSITVTFVCLIYPALVLCYAGQAAFISKNLGVSKDVFLLSESVPNRSIRHIFRVLSLFASAVGSQATITASFSIINQCLALGCFPRVKVIHTSDKIHGQVYIPDVNWMLMLFNIAITIGFRNISLIGNATGDTFPLGCAFDELIVYHKYFEYNLDSKNSTYSTKNGIYSEGCGLDNVMISWGHDDYMYLVVKEHGMTLPPAALFIIRYHSFYPLHKSEAYTHLMNTDDVENLKWLKIFNKYDLYSKSKVRIDVEKLFPSQAEMVNIPN
ncbi:unnamed protein product [Camellia sinensis]